MIRFDLIIFLSTIVFHSFFIIESIIFKIINSITKEKKTILIDLVIY